MLYHKNIVAFVHILYQDLHLYLCLYLFHVVSFLSLSRQWEQYSSVARWWMTHSLRPMTPSLDWIRLDKSVVGLAIPSLALATALYCLILALTVHSKLSLLVCHTILHSTLPLYSYHGIVLHSALQCKQLSNLPPLKNGDAVHMQACMCNRSQTSNALSRCECGCECMYEYKKVHTTYQSS